jgi:hypothetical protein
MIDGRDVVVNQPDGSSVLAEIPEILQRDILFGLTYIAFKGFRHLDLVKIAVT